MYNWIEITIIIEEPWNTKKNWLFFRSVCSVNEDEHDERYAAHQHALYVLSKRHWSFSHPTRFDMVRQHHVHWLSKFANAFTGIATVQKRS